MKYHVDVSGRARHDIGEHYAYQRENYSIDAAERWLLGIERAMRTLDQMPHRCPLAPENEHTGLTSRYLLYRGYRVVYEVIGRRVGVQRVFHSSMAH